ncbi:MAG TPA: thioesterase [Thermoprotei archaeon]|nr:thioesterase [Thermoprotei archaeon]
MVLTPGMEFEKVYESKPEDSARHLGSGSLEVFSTPSMIKYMEETARILADNHLEEGKTTVGIHVDIYHMKAAPIGVPIKFRVKLLSVDGKRLVFWVEAWWKDKKLGHGIHERYVIDRESFIKKLEAELHG